MKKPVTNIEIIAVPAPEDGLVFDSQSASVEETQIDADYQGIRVKLIAQLERTREYPNILPDLKTVRMKGYPKESVVAEKFHAMIHHGDLNSRMKDYYDLWLISETFEFDGMSLQKAIEGTFNNRDTDIPGEKPSSLSAKFAREGQTRWVNFLNKIGLDHARVDDFELSLIRFGNFSNSL